MECAEKGGGHYKTFRDTGFEMQINNLCIDSSFSGLYIPIDNKFGG